jgi:hypothetical protein
VILSTSNYQPLDGCNEILKDTLCKAFFHFFVPFGAHLGIHRFQKAVMKPKLFLGEFFRVV